MSYISIGAGISPEKVEVTNTYVPPAGSGDPVLDVTPLVSAIDKRPSSEDVRSLTEAVWSLCRAVSEKDIKAVLNAPSITLPEAAPQAVPEVNVSPKLGIPVWPLALALSPIYYIIVRDIIKAYFPW